MDNIYSETDIGKGEFMSDMGTKRELPIKLALPDDFLQEENRCDHFISSEMKAVWAVELDLYTELKRVCDKHHLTLLGDGGTVLGAVRHGGFIPWDDDMDFLMPRDDYDRLCAIAPTEFAYPYFWKTEDTNPGCLRGHAQLTNSETTAILAGEKDSVVDTNKGIFIDIFQFDNVPDDLAERTSFMGQIVSLRHKMGRYATWYYGDNRSTGIKRVVKSILFAAFKVFNRQYRNKYYEELEELRHKYDNQETAEWANLGLVFDTKSWKRLVQCKEWYNEIKKVKFEFLEIEILGDYDAYLTHVYGDWHKMIKGTSTHGSVFFDPYTSYRTYVAKKLS